MGQGPDRTRDPWICSQTCICCQTHYRLRYAARYNDICDKLNLPVRQTKSLLFVLFDLIIYVSSTIFQLNRDRKSLLIGPMIMQSMNNIIKQTTDWEKNFRSLKLRSKDYVISQFKEVRSAIIRTGELRLAETH